MNSAFDPIHVKTKYGEICGKKVIGINDVPYYSFQGIPYAKPPINELRFKAPVEPEAWTGVRDATKEGNRCASFNRNGEISGVEDCLYLNVYTPGISQDDSKLKPVLFWIHGGGFYMGSGSADFYSPDYLIAEDVLLVTFNYRLGIFGWLKFDDPALEAPGNAGGKDIILALKWVQENIVQFNGDPNNVTVFGQSAGGICAHLLIISPLATGLFHKVICQAGTSFVGFDKRTRLFKPAFKYAEFLGFHSSNEKEVFEFLATQPAENLVKAMMIGKKWMKYKCEEILGPHIENTHLEPMFVPDEPENIFLKGLINKVPMIIGCTSEDGMVYLTKDFEDSLIPPDVTEAESFVPRELYSLTNLKEGSKEAKELGKNIQRAYYGIESPSCRNKQIMIKYQTDTKYALRIKRAIKFHQANNAGPVYLYRFSFDSPTNLYKKMFDWKSNGATHADELYYLFHTKYSKPFAADSFEDKTRYRMVKFWTNFAKTSDPNPSTLDSIINVKWQPVQWGQMNHLNIGKYLKAYDTQPDDKRMKLWDDIYKAYYEDRIMKIQKNLTNMEIDESKKEENTARIESTKLVGIIR